MCEWLPKGELGEKIRDIVEMLKDTSDGDCTITLAGAELHIICRSTCEKRSLSLQYFVIIHSPTPPAQLLPMSGEHRKRHNPPLVEAISFLVRTTGLEPARSPTGT